MNIVIVGAGNVGCALGSDWLKTGHKVTMAVREPTSSNAIELKKGLLVPVHHRLRLLTFPMRTIPLTRH
jgi:predicted dinucleotide-binding enzyme